MSGRKASRLSSDQWVVLAISVQAACFSMSVLAQRFTAGQSELVRYALIPAALWIAYLLATPRHAVAGSRWFRWFRAYFLVSGSVGALTGLVFNGFAFLGMGDTATFPIYIGLLLPLAMLTRLQLLRR